MRPLVSIIIPTYNRSHLIGETLDSVINQTYSHWECIVVDDRSDDYTEELINFYRKKDPRIKLFQRPEELSKGAAGCRNIGIRNSIGDFIQFLDSDDLLSKSCLENRIQFIINYPRNNLWVFKTANFHTGSVPQLFNTLPNLQNEKDFYLKSFLDGSYPFTVISTIWKKQYLRELNGFDTEFLLLEDPVLHVKSLLADGKIVTDIEGKIDTFYRTNNVSKRDQIQIWKYQLKFAKKYKNEFRNYNSAYFYKIIKSLFCDDFSFKYFKKTLSLGVKTRNISLLFFFKSMFFSLYYISKLNHKRYIGFNTVRKLVLKK
ncbi:glycosyltransferase family 2 protein [Salegentibacter sp. Hel_I_6]|uniref:glycosyltransferase family 2 protein n=1 Tax=Salegentibacter sp. Hel_I_6 TaxID=1250278 RepID=UPI0009DFA050|nr:glycosyltransferase family 2 protein [Salegentibacter sp. Hel_I_6]